MKCDEKVDIWSNFIPLSRQQSTIKTINEEMLYFMKHNVTKRKDRLFKGFKEIYSLTRAPYYGNPIRRGDSFISLTQDRKSFFIFTIYNGQNDNDIYFNSLYYMLLLCYIIQFTNIYNLLNRKG